jgi:hypothetical protein
MINGEKIIEGLCTGPAIPEYIIPSLILVILKIGGILLLGQAILCGLDILVEAYKSKSLVACANICFKKILDEL